MDNVDTAVIVHCCEGGVGRDIVVTKVFHLVMQGHHRKNLGGSGAAAPD